MKETLQNIVRDVQRWRLLLLEPFKKQLGDVSGAFSGPSGGF